MARVLHALGYGIWLVGQVYVATWEVVKDAFSPRTKIEPCVVAYPLRVTSARDIAAFSTSITMTPGTLSFGILNEDDQFPTDLAPAKEPHAAVPVPESDLPRLNSGDGNADDDSDSNKDGADDSLRELARDAGKARWLLVQAVFGQDPDAVMADLADMEARMAPHVRELTQPGKEWEH